MSANRYPKTATFRRFALCGIPLSIAVAVAVYFALPRLQMPTDNTTFPTLLLLMPSSRAEISSPLSACAKP